MIKAVVDLGSNAKLKPKVLQAASAYEEYADELALILDRIIIDEFIKEVPSAMKLSEKDQKAIILEKRNWILDLIRNLPVDMSYVQSDETSCFDLLNNDLEKFTNSYRLE